MKGDDMGARVYKNGSVTVSMGNAKLSKGIMLFNLPAIQTCPNCSMCAKTCYARKAERRYATVLACRERNHAASQQTCFVARMVELVKRTGATKVRIHEAGDFYSQAYADKWTEIARRCPGVRFYGYSKSPFRPMALHNMNVVESILPGGELNYGKRGDMLQLAKTYKAKVCPYGHAKKAFRCGTECVACLTHKYIVFVQH